MIKETQTIIAGRIPLASPADTHEPPKYIQNKSKKKDADAFFPKRTATWTSTMTSDQSTNRYIQLHYQHGRISQLAMVLIHIPPPDTSKHLCLRKKCNNCLERGWLLVYQDNQSQFCFNPLSPSN